MDIEGKQLCRGIWIEKRPLEMSHCHEEVVIDCHPLFLLRHEGPTVMDNHFSHRIDQEKESCRVICHSGIQIARRRIADQNKAP